MLTQLATLKARLKIEESYLVDDELLTNFIKLVSGRFQLQCNRLFERAENVTEEFAADETEIRCARYPIEEVTRWDLKSNESEGWVEQLDIDFLIRRACVISLTGPLGTHRQQGRVIYSGGYVMPDETVDAGQTALPDEIEQACLAQCDYLYKNRNSPGLTAVSGAGGSISKPAAATTHGFQRLPMGITHFMLLHSTQLGTVLSIATPFQMPLSFPPFTTLPQPDSKSARSKHHHDDHPKDNGDYEWRVGGSCRRVYGHTGHVNAPG